MMRVLGLALLVVVAAMMLVGGAEAVTQTDTTILYQYDLDATAVTYCNLTGAQGGQFTGGSTGIAPIKTTGSSTTVAEFVASTNPFALLSVGDVIAVNRGTGSQNVDLRVITAKASASSITINTAVDWSGGFFFQWFKLNCGTSATSGWIDVSGYTARTFIVQIEQLNTTGGIDIQFECKGGYMGAAPVKIFPGATSDCSPGTLGTGVCTFTAAAGRLALSVPEAWGACRVGMLIHTSDDGGDTGANAEQITIGFIGQKAM